MKEYRIIATIDYKHGNGETAHYDIAIPWVDGVPYGKRRFDTKGEAAKELKRLKKVCAEADKKNNERFDLDPRNYIHRVQSNIRIQMREVTEWANV